MFNDARLTNFIANSLALLAVLALILGVVLWVAQRPYFAITQIQIEPMQADTLNYVSATSVRATIAGRLAGNFFTVNLNDTRKLLETVPWVRRAQIRRVWPNTLRVQIEEQQPLALWNENQMINTWGEAFSANQGELPDDANLPHFYGPAQSERLVVQRYAELARWFAPLNLHVKQITLSPRYAWDVELSDGVRLSLGRDPAADVADPHGRSGALPFAARIERFVKTWPVLMQRLGGRAVRSADLRYSNGFAITLAPVSPTSTK
ncbi:cell division protein FtsQ/DivIB [Paralcaligenes sp. KSB-10]|uniref:cell division protein FtsQ/DivIB n=1 Tax=Paralcaligenes sp. KSB-10 TaxID=2901142 RepID=UPI001E5077F1|nr:cell division protein FtsQ/DivIB [Paralcaligenes sp. KSB-10]UHL65817.1 cell division protein FtsQ/DivIB [Paralcaligenes sp. KSB-10]